jgi:hypothetical protein
LTMPLFMYPIFILEVSTRLRFTQPRSTENYAMSSFHSCILFYTRLISCSKIVVVFWSKYVITVAPNDYFEWCSFGYCFQDLSIVGLNTSLKEPLFVIDM